MNSPRIKKPIQFLTDSSQRAHRLNNATDRILEQKISHYKREEKQLQKELANLRKTKETLDSGIKLIFPQRERSNSEPISPRSVIRANTSRFRFLGPCNPQLASNCHKQSYFFKKMCHIAR